MLKLVGELSDTLVFEARHVGAGGANESNATSDYFVNATKLLASMLDKRLRSGNYRKTPDWLGVLENFFDYVRSYGGRYASARLGHTHLADHLTLVLVLNITWEPGQIFDIDYEEEESNK